MARGRERIESNGGSGLTKSSLGTQSTYAQTRVTTSGRAGYDGSMAPILIGALIEAAGIIFFVIGVGQHGFPPGLGWLIPAIVLFVAGNTITVLAVVKRAMDKKKKNQP